MFLQLHTGFLFSLIFGFYVLMMISGFFFIKNWLINIRQNRHVKPTMRFLGGFVGFLFLTVVLSWAFAFDGVTSRCVASISTWHAPVKVDKIVSDEVNGSNGSGMQRVRYIVTDNHVYAIHNSKSIVTKTVHTKKPTYFTYVYRGLKPNATRLEREYFKAAKSGNRNILVNHNNKIKFGKLVKHADLR
jgi:hypothetical protein